MAASRILVQAICGQPKAYRRLCDYIDRPRGTFSWTLHGQTIEHAQKVKNPGDYRASIHLEATSNEVVVAQVTHRAPGVIGAFVGLCIRCFGEDLIAINVQNKDSD